MIKSAAIIKNAPRSPWREVRLAKKKAKKEAQLERLALRKEINHTMAIFSLKQLGWKDTQDIAHSGTIKAEVNHDLSRLSNEELRDLECIIGKTTSSQVVVITESV